MGQSHDMKNPNKHVNIHARCSCILYVTLSQSSSFECCFLIMVMFTEVMHAAILL